MIIKLSKAEQSALDHAQYKSIEVRQIDGWGTEDIDNALPFTVYDVNKMIRLGMLHRNANLVRITAFGQKALEDV